jgi:hypothetical protein
MPVNTEFHQFIQSWLQKAHDIALTDLNAHFNRFFTLYVVYNRLYAEATFILARQGQLNLHTRKSFPDKDAATRYVCQYIGSAILTEEFDANPDVAQALLTIEELIERNTFSIKLHVITGASQRAKDVELLDGMRSTSRDKRATAILEMIYAIRCNMFHGHKEFHPVQAEILAPAMIIMEKVISLLQRKVELG